MTKTKNQQKQVTEILGHDVAWGVTSPKVQELPESDVEHIKAMIEDGYTSGELCVIYNRGRNETTGWWEIINYESLALNLYNALKGMVRAHEDGGNIHYNDEYNAAKAALKRFDENWHY